MRYSHSRRASGLVARADNRNFRPGGSIPILNELYFKFDRYEITDATPTANYEPVPRALVIFHEAAEIYWPMLDTRARSAPRDHSTQIETVNRTVALSISLSFNRASTGPRRARRARDTINNHVDRMWFLLMNFASVSP